MKIFKNEKELAKIVVNFLNDNKFEVYQEVDTRPISGIIDIVAVNNNILWCIECKLSLSLNVIQQAYKHIKYSNYVSIAVPDTKYKNNNFISNILNIFKIGLIIVGYDYVYEFTKAKLNRRIYKQAYIKKLNSKQKIFCNAGSNNRGYYTKFKDTKIQLINYIKTHEGCLIKDAINNINHHYNTISTAKSCIMKYIQEGIIEEIEIKKDIKKNRLYIKRNNI